MTMLVASSENLERDLGTRCTRSPIRRLAFPGAALGGGFGIFTCARVDTVASWGAASSAPTEYWKVGTLAALFRFESSKQLRVVGIWGTGYIGLVAELARNSDCAALHAARS